MAETNQSFFYFPLRTNANYFDSPAHYLALKERIKQAAVLYDILVFEDGCYSAAVWADNVIEIHFPVEAMPLEEREQKLSGFQPTGGEEMLRIEFENTETPFVISGPIKRRFYAEFHTVLTEIEAHHHPWMKMSDVELTTDGKSLLSKLEQMDSKRMNWQAARAKGEHFLRSTIIKNLNHDLIVCADRNATGSLHPAFDQILRHKQNDFPAKTNEGLLSLEIVVPNFSVLSWDDVLEVRENRAMKQFREKLFYIESVSRDASPDTDIRDLKLLVHQTFTRELREEIAHLVPALSQGTSNVALDFLVGLIPIPGLSTGVTAVREGVEWLKFNNSWLSAYFKLIEKCN